MKILVIAASTTEQAGTRGIQCNVVLNALLKQEVQMHLITSQFSIVDDFSNKYFDTPLLSLNCVDHSFNQFSTFNKIRNKLYPIQTNINYAINAFKIAKNILSNNEIDAVLSFSMPVSDLLVGIRLKRQFPGMRWVTFFSDPLINNEYRVYKKRKVQNLIERISSRRVLKNVLKYADSLIVPSKIMARDIVNFSSGTVTPTVIPHSFDKLQQKKSLADKQKIIFSYIGSFYGQRNPNILLKVLTDLYNKNQSIADKIHVNFIGRTDRTIQQQMSEYKLGFVDIIDHIPKEKLHKKLDETNICLLIDAPLKHSPFLPSKLVEYISLNKIILGITPQNGESYRVLKENGHIVFDNSDYQGIYSFFESILTDTFKFNQLLSAINKHADSYDAFNNIKLYKKVLKEPASS